MKEQHERPQLSQEAYGDIGYRTCDDHSTLLEVDHMILDHLVHQAIMTCLSNARPNQVTTTLLQADHYHHLFSTNHADYVLDPSLHFRLQLLQLTALFTQRHHQTPTTPPQPSLDLLREQNSLRAKTWLARGPTPTHDFSAFDTVALPSPSHANNLPSLLDLLPLFMRLSAASCETLFNGQINAHWMHLAAEWMLQAVLEQRLFRGARSSGVIDEAFAWGYKADGEEGDAVNSMFEEEGIGREIEGWSRVRGEVLEELAKGEDLRRLEERWSIQAFLEKVRGFLEALSKSVEEPVLVQLEKGELVGMSRQDTQKFLIECGVGALW
jgi:hypothetical protein